MNARTTATYFGPVFNAVYSYDGRKLPTDYELLREYATNDIVYACVNFNAFATAQVPIRLYAKTGNGQKAIRSHRTAGVSRATKARLRANPNLAKMIGPGDDVVEITEHPLLNLLEDDHDGLNGFDFRILTQVYKEIMGRAYWQDESAGITGMPTSLYMLKPQRLMPVRDGNGAVIGYKYQPDLRGLWEDLDLDEVEDFRFPHPEDPYGWGMSPLKAAFAQAELTTKFTKFGNDLMDNRARIDGMFIPADDLGGDMARKAEGQFEQRFGGGRAGGVWFSPTKGTFVPTRYAPTDLGPMEVDKNTVSRVCRAFTIPEPLMSANEATFSNMDKALHFHAKFAVLPRILQYENRLNYGLVPKFDDRLFLAADNPIPEDDEFNLQRTQVAITAKVLTPNETRESLGFEPMEEEGMDDLPASDEEMQQKQLDAKAGESAAANDKSDDNDAEPTQKAIFDTGRLIEINKAVVSGDMPRTAAISAIVKAFDVTAEEARELVGYVKETPVAKTPEVIQKSEGPHKFASTQVQLTGEIGGKMLAFAQSIPANELADDGIETDPHVTVKYGIHSDDPKGVIEAVKQSEPITLTLGDLTLFPATDDHDYDVLKIDVDSPALSALHDVISEACENTETHSTYQPHATIAYLKRGIGQKYVGKSPVSGETFTANQITFSATDGTRTAIYLQGVQKAIAKASTPDTALDTPKDKTPNQNQKLWMDWREATDDRGTPLIEKSTALDTLVDSHHRLTDEQRKRRKQFLLLLLAFFGWQAEQLAAGGDVKATDPKFNARLTSTLTHGMHTAFVDAIDQSTPEIVHAGMKQIETVAADMAAKINAATATEIESSTASGIAIADAVNAIYERAIGHRVEAIEGDMTFVGEQIAVQAEAGVMQRELMWETEGDEKVCAVCGPLNGLVAKVGEPFAPGVFLPVVNTHGNCRCKLKIVPLESSEKNNG